jgi:nitrate/TMAO reductase-like tetraheme cytochrome c subunit
MGFGSQESTRDTRRAFTQSQRKEILYQQNNKCAECHKSLDPRDIEYDHKDPWAANGRTVEQNGRALCGSCHNLVTHQAQVKKVNSKRKSKPRPSDTFGIRVPEFKLGF